ncbi:MAG TPA: TRAP transporter substrate-binding protein DctP, partial [Rhodocyclaceae bacterium]|nr:TRAP transporter substrate-binding protein DctP [Rhodocyclaceae bacterium]
MQFFADQVKEKTNGKYEPKVYANAILGDQNKAVAMLKTGEIGFAEVNLTPLSKAVPQLEALSLPFLFRNSEHMLSIMDSDIGKELEAALFAKGYVVVGWYDGGARSFYTKNKPVRFASDYAGKRIRVADNKLFKDMVSALGATPVVVPYKDVNKSFEDDTIDGAENNLPAFESEQHYKYAKYFSFSNHIVLPEALVVSMPLWAKLTDDERIIFKEAGQASAVYMREQFNKRLQASRAKLEKQGVKFYDLQDAGPFISRMRDIYQPYIDNPVTSGLVIRIMTTSPR